MIKFRQTYLSACKEKLAKDESGLSTTRYLDTLMQCGRISQKEADEYFRQAEYEVWIEPWEKEDRAWRQLRKIVGRKKAAA